MASFRSWIRAARLRTLPLALSSIAMGGVVASQYPGFRLQVVMMAALTTLFLQILSNLANDYGDSFSGIDNDRRVGPRRTVQSGEISSGAMKAAIAVFSVLSLASGLILIFHSASLDASAAVLFILMGLGAIAAAIKYTIGRNPYGYQGLGDLFVFLFFGLLAVGGTFYLATGQWHPIVLLPASAMGLLSTGVLNLNNMRDIDNDRMSQKNTMVVKLGLKKAFIYHCMLVLLPFVLLTIWLILTGAGIQAYLFLLVLPLFIVDLVTIAQIKGGARLDPFLRKLALKTLLLTLLFGIFLNL
ncbi:MAG: 1,4-dihydroxy-2-naphthoate octaprenyltransferase [Bacteroidales bacterium]